MIKVSNNLTQLCSAQARSKEAYDWNALWQGAKSFGRAYAEPFSGAAHYWSGGRVGSDYSPNSPFINMVGSMMPAAPSPGTSMGNLLSQMGGPIISPVQKLHSRFQNWVTPPLNILNRNPFQIPPQAQNQGRAPTNVGTNGFMPSTTGAPNPILQQLLLNSRMGLPNPMMQNPFAMGISSGPSNLSRNHP